MTVLKPQALNDNSQATHITQLHTNKVGHTLYTLYKRTGELPQRSGRGLRGHVAHETDIPRRC